MGYNKGDNYEQNIFDLLTARGLIATGSTRGGAGNATDIKFLHNFQEYNLEVKLLIDIPSPEMKSLPNRKIKIRKHLKTK